MLPSPYLDHERSPNSRVTHLEKTIQELRDELARSRRVTDQEKDGLNDIIRLLRADLHRQQTSSVNLEKTTQELRDQLATSHRATNQEKDTLKVTTESSHVQEESSTNKITHLVQTVEELRVQLADSQHKAESLIRIIRAHEQKRQCESLYAQGRIYDTAESLLEIANTTKEDLRANKLVIDWLDGMTHQCVTTLERGGEEASNAEKQDEDYCIIAHSPT
ncbi:hypothetical protein J3R82DRAFT_11018 [Butyriboletus roseoflavus]|nr:hypothetical protein J3R82DRAFT_11018 [Butyriboletus roseoflavus]